MFSLCNIFNMCNILGNTDFKMSVIYLLRNGLPDTLFFILCHPVCVKYSCIRVYQFIAIAWESILIVCLLSVIGPEFAQTLLQQCVCVWGGGGHSSLRCTSGYWDGIQSYTCTLWSVDMNLIVDCNIHNLTRTSPWTVVAIFNKPRGSYNI